VSVEETELCGLSSLVKDILASKALSFSHMQKLECAPIVRGI